ncbi:hypothetical protein BAE44_0019944 [Dichanthelium oligosanthes]|uniref:Uncharacterized protein n=1 Tax=Dichanthelium oligosanthes TaxID=888268 RepID=A0A1E5V1S5_9POAL|nr:hypothetical protein BAE44_0019944 [Dichanthelium oligosanthes]
MRLRKRVGDGGGDPGDDAVLGALGLGAFARLALPDHPPPEELGLAAAYDEASGRILLTLAGAAAFASPADLADALELPRGPVGLAAGVDAALFSSAEAIAAVSGFVRDRVILGGEGGGGPASGEVAAALRLVEEGKAYEVGWGGLVWAVVKGEVVAGTPRRYAPYLLLLMERLRPELFTELDGRLPRQKRWKGQWTGGVLLDSDYIELEEEEDASLVFGGSQDIGDLEDMPIFSEGKNVAFVGGEEIHALNQGNAEHESLNFLHSDVNRLGHKMEWDDREGGCSQSSAKQDDLLSQQQVISMTQSQPESKPQRMIVIEVENDNNVNVDVGLSQLQEVGGIHNYQTLSPFQSSMQQIRGYVPAMEIGYLDVEKACRDTQDEVERIKKMVMEKDHLYAATMSDIQEELRVWSTIMRPHEANMDLMYRTVQKYHTMLEKSLAEFQEYRNWIVHGEGVESYSEVLDISAVEEDGEGEASLSKTVDRSSEGEGCLVSNTTQRGNQLVELIANPDQRNITGESMDLNGVQQCSSEDEPCDGGAASQGTS